MKAFAPSMLGAGLKGGGVPAHRKKRKGVLNRLAARGAELSAQGTASGHGSLTHGTRRCAQSIATHGGNMFAEQMQHLSEALAAGEASAMADYVVSETQRALKDVLVMRV